MTNQILESFSPSEKCSTSSIIQWVPPIVNWNPWISSNIDEGPLACATMESISEDLYQAEQYLHQTRIHHLPWKQREQLPVFPYRDKILDEIQRNNVVLIRGATGCGKTTQVRFYSIVDRRFF